MQSHCALCGGFSACRFAGARPACQRPSTHLRYARLLDAAGGVVERRARAVHDPLPAPRLVAPWRRCRGGAWRLVRASRARAADRPPGPVVAFCGVLACSRLRDESPPRAPRARQTESRSSTLWLLPSYSATTGAVNHVGAHAYRGHAAAAQPSSFALCGQEGSNPFGRQGDLQVSAWATLRLEICRSVARFPAVTRPFSISPAADTALDRFDERGVLAAYLVVERDQLARPGVVDVRAEEVVEEADRSARRLGPHRPDRQVGEPG